jgi:hypothetical protein
LDIREITFGFIYHFPSEYSLEGALAVSKNNLYVSLGRNQDGPLKKGIFASTQIKRCRQTIGNCPVHLLITHNPPKCQKNSFENHLYYAKSNNK